MTVVIVLVLFFFCFFFRFVFFVSYFELASEIFAVFSCSTVYDVPHMVEQPWIECRAGGCGFLVLFLLCLSLMFFCQGVHWAVCAGGCVYGCVRGGIFRVGGVVVEAKL
jgi:hypothetical protein